MANKISFNMSDKSLLVKLHEVALKNAGIEYNKNTNYVLLNSGIAYDGNLAQYKQNLSDEVEKNDKIAFFSNKNGLYEVGIYVKEKELGKIGKFAASSLVEPAELYKQLYGQLKSKNNNKQLDDIKDKAYAYLTDYMAAFCGDKYAKSISKDKVKAYAFDKPEQAETTEHSYELGECSKKVKHANVLLYKIGYSVGAKK